MNDQQFEPYEITPDNNPRVAYGVLEKAYKEVKAENERLRGALEDIDAEYSALDPLAAYRMSEIARAALRGEEADGG